MTARYSVRIFWSDEDGGYVASIPELEDLSAFGETAEAAFAELAVARELWLEELDASGEDAPPPLSLPGFSGQFRLRVPRSLHAWLAARAEVEGISLNTLIVQILSEARGEGRARLPELVTPSPAHPSEPSLGRRATSQGR